MPFDWVCFSPFALLVGGPAVVFFFYMPLEGTWPAVHIFQKQKSILHSTLGSILRLKSIYIFELKYVFILEQMKSN